NSPRLGPDPYRVGRGAISDAFERMGPEERHALPVPDLRNPARISLEQRAGGLARGRRIPLARILHFAMGRLGEPSLRQAGDLVGDLDLAAFARIWSDAPRHESGGRS